MANTPFLTEDFIAPDGTLLENIGTGLVRSTVSGSNGAAQVMNNRALQSSTTTAVYAWGNNLAPGPNYEVSAKYFFNSSAGNPSVGICGRMAGTGGAPLTFYQARLVNNTSGLVLARFLNGSGITLLSTPMNYVFGDEPKITLRMQGSQLTVLVNDQLSLGPHTDTSITEAGYVGLRMASANVNQIRVTEVRATSLDVAPQVQVSISQVEVNDSHSVVASVAVRASISHIESSDSQVVSGRIDVLAVADWTEADETTSAQIQVGGGVSISISHTEGRDKQAATGVVSVSAVAMWTEGRESTVILVQSQGESAGDIDALLVPPRQTVVFEGSRRVVAFEGGQRVVSFEGSKRLVEFQ